MNETILSVLDQIDHNPYQPRHGEDPALVAEIAASIERNGLMQTPTARQMDGRYQLAFGHTRLAAFQLLASQGKTEYASMPLFVRVLTDLQMFELGVAENIKRRDLNPIETAQAMQTYLETFQKTSEEAGEFFGVSAETVRGTVRLLGLPEAIREKMRTGEVTIGTARKLLTVQRISADAALKAADEIVKLEAPNGEDVDYQLEDAVRTAKVDVVSMWEDWRKKEPRGGPHLWPLGWQHKGSLAPMTEEHVIGLLGFKAKDLKGQDMQENRRQVAMLMNRIQAGMLVERADFSFGASALEKIAHLADPPTCLDCPYYTKLLEQHYCGLRACWDRKKDAWLKKELQRFSKDLGIAIYDPAVDPAKYVLCDTNYGDELKRFKQMLAKKDPLLRLVVHKKGFDLPITNHGWIGIADISDRAQKSEAAQTAREKRDEAARKRQAAQMERANRNEQASDKFIEEVAAPLFAKVLEGLTCVDVLQALTNYGSNDRYWRQYKALTPIKKRRFLQVELMRKLLVGEGDFGEIVPPPYQPTSPARKGPLAVAKHLQSVARTWGLKLPKDWLERAKAHEIPAESESA